MLVEDIQESEEGSCYDEASNREDLGATDLATSSPGKSNCHFYTYHIIYNEVFRVPKLFMKGRFPDGRPLQWQNLQHVLPFGLAHDNTKWTFLTYEEHPFLHVPWLALHPCGTSSLMALAFSQISVGQTSLVGSVFAINSTKSGSVLANSSGKGMDTQEPTADNDLASVALINCYILTWLSFASQAVALRLPTSFMKCFKNGISENLVSDDLLAATL